MQIKAKKGKLWRDGVLAIKIGWKERRYFKKSPAVCHGSHKFKKKETKILSTRIGSQLWEEVRSEGDRKGKPMR